MKDSLTLGKNVEAIDQEINSLIAEIRQLSYYKTRIKSLNDQTESYKNLRTYFLDILTNQKENNRNIRVLFIKTLDLLSQRDDLEDFYKYTKNDLELIGKRLGKKFMFSPNSH